MVDIGADWHQGGLQREPTGNVKRCGLQLEGTDRSTTRSPWSIKPGIHLGNDRWLRACAPHLLGTQYTHSMCLSVLVITELEGSLLSLGLNLLLPA